MQLAVRGADCPSVLGSPFAPKNSLADGGAFGLRKPLRHSGIPQKPVMRVAWKIRSCIGCACARRFMSGLAVAKYASRWHVLKNKKNERPGLNGTTPSKPVKPIYG